MSILVDGNRGSIIDVRGLSSVGNHMANAAEQSEKKETDAAVLELSSVGKEFSKKMELNGIVDEGILTDNEKERWANIQNADLGGFGDIDDLCLGENQYATRNMVLTTDKFGYAAELESVGEQYYSNYFRDNADGKVMDLLEEKYAQIRETVEADYSGGELQERLAELEDNYRAVGKSFMIQAERQFANGISGYRGSLEMAGIKEISADDKGEVVIHKNEELANHVHQLLDDAEENGHDAKNLKNNFMQYFVNAATLNQYSMQNIGFYRT